MLTILLIIAVVCLIIDGFYTIAALALTGVMTILFLFLIQSVEYEIFVKKGIIIERDIELCAVIRSKDKAMSCRERLSKEIESYNRTLELKQTNLNTPIIKWTISPNYENLKPINYE